MLIYARGEDIIVRTHNSHFDLILYNNMYEENKRKIYSGLDD